MEHGKRSTYVRGCRCGECLQSTRDYRRAYESTPAGLAGRRAAVTKNRLARKEWLNQIKLESGCVDCGYDSNAVALQFDHLDNKEFMISTNRNLSKARLLEEISKCEVVCANCHAIRTTRRAREKQSRITGSN